MNKPTPNKALPLVIAVDWAAEEDYSVVVCKLCGWTKQLRHGESIEHSCPHEALNIEATNVES